MRNRNRKYYPDGGEVKKGEENYPILKGSLTPQEQNFLYRNLLNVDDPFNEGNKITYGQLFDDFKSPDNRNKVTSYIKQLGYTPNLEGINKYITNVFNESKGKLSAPIKIPREYVNEIEKDRSNRRLSTGKHYTPKLDEFLKKEKATYDIDQINKYLLLKEETPERLATQSKGVGDSYRGAGNQYNDGGDIINIGSSLLTTAGNMIDANQLKVNQTPALIKRRRTPYKSSVEPILNRNEASYRTLAADTRGRGDAAVTKALGFSNLLNNNTQVIQQDINNQNRQNLVESQLDLEAASQNAQTTNTIGAANISRYNNRLTQRNQAFRAGNQDIININTNKQARELQRQGLTVELLSSLDPDELEKLLEVINSQDGQDIISQLGFK